MKVLSVNVGFPRKVPELRGYASVDPEVILNEYSENFKLGGYLPEIPRDRQTALHNDMIDALNSAYSKGLFKEYEYQQEREELESVISFLTDLLKKVVKEVTNNTQ